MVKFAEADARRFKGVFVCRKCKKAIRAPALKVIAQDVTCPKCGRHVLRPRRKK